MPFCNNCGTQVDEVSRFCVNCGQPLNNQPNYTQPQQNYQYPPYQPPQYNPYARPIRPKTPGKGIGIAAMIVGIASLLYGALFLLVTAAGGGGGDDMLPAVFMLMPTSILAICFANASLKQGFQNGISKSGLTTGIIALVCYVLSFLANID